MLVHAPQAQLTICDEKQCLDVGETDGAVRGWDCGVSQPNQMWSLGSETELVAYFGTYSAGQGQDGDYGGKCLTVLG